MSAINSTDRGCADERQSHVFARSSPAKWIGAPVTVYRHPPSDPRHGTPHRASRKPLSEHVSFAHIGDHVMIFSKHIWAIQLPREANQVRGNSHFKVIGSIRTFRYFPNLKALKLRIFSSDPHISLQPYLPLPVESFTCEITFLDAPGNSVPDLSQKACHGYSE